MDALDASSTRRNARFGKGGYTGYKKNIKKPGYFMVIWLELEYPPLLIFNDLEWTKWWFNMVESVELQFLWSGMKWIVI